MPTFFATLSRHLAVVANAKWMSLYLRVLSGVLIYGATVHAGNMLGLTGKPWFSTPLLWRVMDVVLLVFDVVVSVGLWQRRVWAIAAFVFGIICLQILPYTLLRNAFIMSPADAQTLNGLIGSELVLLGVLVGLIVSGK